ncbi:hypothetical protein BGX28_003324 [Mortierella sp. GBA30]|nr:hypothetical protein BGX28_003324 [Mortierella sp. GBA30]
MSHLSAVDSVTGAREKIGDLLHDGIKQVSYQILDILGYGTYGCIYLAKTVSNAPGSMPEYKAIKCLSKKGLSATQLLLQRQEIDIHLSLSSGENGQHPHIVDMTSVIENNDSLYLVMEYCSGGDLYDAITSQHSAVRDSGVDFAPLMNLSGRFLNVHSDRSVLDAMTQIISALAHAHTRQVFHRDLKPENILVANDGSLKLADFGLATKDRVSTDFGCGSSFYMAPEQQQPTRSSGSTAINVATTGRRPYLPAKSDVWSLGIILLNLRFGRNPWKLSRADMDATFAAYAENSDVLREMFPELSSSALYFLKRVLCVDPNDRADCFEALELIKRVDTILTDDDVQLRSQEEYDELVSMEGCSQDLTDSEVFDNSSVSSSRSSESRSFSSCSSVSSCYSEDYAGYDEEEDEIDSMFRMDDFRVSARHSNPATTTAMSPSVSSDGNRNHSNSSNWSMASSRKSGKSWSDMVEEDEMDFSLPVQFDETNSIDGAPLSVSVEASDDKDQQQDQLKDQDQEQTSSKTVKTCDSTHNNDANDSDNDFSLTTVTITTITITHQQDAHYTECYDNTHYTTRPCLSSSTTTDSPRSLASSWFLLPSTWIHDDLRMSLAHAGLTRLSELMSSGGSLSRSCSRTLLVPSSGMFSFGSRLLSNPP